jgi:hypothetical protein
LANGHSIDAAEGQTSGKSLPVSFYAENSCLGGMVKHYLPTFSPEQPQPVRPAHFIGTIKQLREHFSYLENVPE